MFLATFVVCLTAEPCRTAGVAQSGQITRLLNIQRGDHNKYDEAEGWVHDVAAGGNGGCGVCGAGNIGRSCHGGHVQEQHGEPRAVSRKAISTQ